MGQDDSCGICGKSECKHLRYREHLAYVHRESGEKASVCGQKDVILFNEGDDVDPERVCRKCLATAKAQGIEIT